MNLDLLKTFLIHSNNIANSERIDDKLYRKLYYHNRDQVDVFYGRGLIPSNFYSINIYSNVPLSIAYIPNNIIELSFDYNFNQPLQKGVIPNSVKILKLGKSFNQHLKVGDLPDGLEAIDFGFSFNKPLNINIIPNTVKTIVLSNNFNQILKKGDIPEGVESLYFNTYTMTLQKDVLPSTLLLLDFGYHYNSNDEYPIINEDVLPFGIKELRMCGNYYHVLKKGVIPNSVRKLRIGYGLTKVFTECFFPESINCLILDCLDVKLNGYIPKSVKTIIFMSYDIKNISYYDIPSHVSYLHIPYIKKDDKIPDTIKYLNVDYDYDFHINENTNLLYLEIPKLNKIFGSYDKLKILVSDTEINDDTKIIGILDGNKIRFNNLGIDVIVNREDKYIIFDFIENNLKKEKLIGNIILEELVSKVFNPNRLIKISKKYNIEFIDLVDLY